MRKLLWSIYTKIRLWYLYRKVDIPYSEKPDYYKCPTCNWDTTNDDFDSKNYLGTSDIEYGYEGTKYWTEHWKCPRCGTVFTVDDSN